MIDSFFFKFISFYLVNFKLFHIQKVNMYLKVLLSVYDIWYVQLEIKKNPVIFTIQTFGKTTFL